MDGFDARDFDQAFLPGDKFHACGMEKVSINPDKNAQRGNDGGAYSGGSASSATSAGTKEQTKLAANQKGSGSGKKRRL